MPHFDCFWVAGMYLAATVEQLLAIGSLGPWGGQTAGTGVMIQLIAGSSPTRNEMHKCTKYQVHALTRLRETPLREGG